MLLAYAGPERGATGAVSIPNRLCIAGLRLTRPARRALVAVSAGVPARPSGGGSRSPSPSPGAVAAPAQGNGAAAAAPAGPQAVTVSGAVPVLGVLPPAGVYEAVSGGADGLVAGAAAPAQHAVLSAGLGVQSRAGQPSASGQLHSSAAAAMQHAIPACIAALPGVWRQPRLPAPRRAALRRPTPPTCACALHPQTCPCAAPRQIANLGAYKAQNPFWKTVLLGVIAGCYVALGAALLLTVGPNCLGIAQANPGLAKYITGAIGFPYALLMILVRAGQLVNCPSEGRASVDDVGQNGWCGCVCLCVCVIQWWVEGE